MQSDADYFSRRASEERRAASTATQSCVRLRHLEFAEAYELRVRMMTEDDHPSSWMLSENTFVASEVAA